MSVYFARSLNSGLIKIGYSESVQERAAALATSHGPIELLCVIGGDRTHEALLHTMFSGHREVGEWFRAGEDLMTFIAKLPPFNPPGKSSAQKSRGDGCRALCRWLDANGISAARFGSMLNVTSGAVRHWMNGYRKPNAQQLAKIRIATNGEIVPNDFFSEAA